MLHGIMELGGIEMIKLRVIIHSTDFLVLNKDGSYTVEDTKGYEQSNEKE